VQLSAAEARRLALAAQGFGKPRPRQATLADVRRTARRVQAIRLDSINVVVRAHYLAPYSRLGAYRMAALDELVYDRRELFEGWAGGVAFLPTELFPLLETRRATVRARGPVGPSGHRLDAGYVDAVLDEVTQRGPLAASELSVATPPRGKWWGWSNSKIAMEYLWETGQVAIAGREDFVRLYDLAERVLPSDVLRAPTLHPDANRKELMCLTAQALGIATQPMLVHFFGLQYHQLPARVAKGQRPNWGRMVAELVEDGRLVVADVDDAKERAYAVPGASVPRSISARALLSPFDPLMRGSQVFFDFEQHLGQQLYVPERRRIFGYYVLPFLLGDALVGRCELKADRASGTLLVPSAHLEPGHDEAMVAGELAHELRDLQAWLGLGRVVVGDRGDLADRLRRNLRR
jgi:uncharacterized protein YcaQ